MVKRTSWKRYFYIGFALILLISCWETGRNHSVALASGANDAAGNQIDFIPQDSIRLRILANSDSLADQWIKHEVRDAIVEQMKQWVDEPQGIEAAREAVHTHLPELNELVGSTLSKHGFSYSYEVELGVVPFPAKMYGNQVYPAGDYEALRVTIGTAEGQNWWCVLFPPLCFVDSEAIVKKTDAANVQPAVSVSKGEGTSSYAQAGKPQQGSDEGNSVKADRTDKADKAEKTGKIDKTDKTDKADKTDKTDKTDRSSVKTDITDKADAHTVNKESGAPAQTTAESRQAPGSKLAENRQSAAAISGSQQPEVRFYLWDLFKKLGSLFA